MRPLLISPPWLQFSLLVLALTSPFSTCAGWRVQESKILINLNIKFPYTTTLTWICFITWSAAWPEGISLFTSSEPWPDVMDSPWLSATCFYRRKKVYDTNQIENTDANPKIASTWKRFKYLTHIVNGRNFNPRIVFIFWWNHRFMTNFHWVLL